MELTTENTENHRRGFCALALCSVLCAHFGALWATRFTVPLAHRCSQDNNSVRRSLHLTPMGVRRATLGWLGGLIRADAVACLFRLDR